MNSIRTSPDRLLVISDNERLTAQLADHPGTRPHILSACADADQAVVEAAQGNHDLILLDMDSSLPGRDGWEVLSALRTVSTVPVVLLSAFADEQARVRGLMAGADDYLHKPFSILELGVRIRALLRRVSLERNAGVEPVIPGTLQLCGDDLQALYGGQDLALTSTEYRLLQVLFEHQDQVLSKPFLYREVLCRDCGRHDRSLDLHVSNLRKKLKKAGVPGSPLRTVWGQGYALDVP